MANILILSQKGGAGKTTIANELVFALERKGKVVNFISVDPQGGSVHAERPVTNRAEYEIVDTPGNLNEDSAMWCRAADMIVIPVRASVRDLGPTLRTYEVAKAATKAPTVFVLNEYNARGRAEREFEEFAAGEGYEIIARIPRRVAISNAAGTGESVAQYPDGKSAAAFFDDLATAITERME